MSWKRVGRSVGCRPYAATLGIACLAGVVALTAAAQITATGVRAISGTVEAVRGDGLTIRGSDGQSHSVRVKPKGERGIALADGRLLAAPVDVKVTGELPAAGLKPGNVVQFRCRLDRSGGRSTSPSRPISPIGSGPWFVTSSSAWWRRSRSSWGGG